MNEIDNKTQLETETIATETEETTEVTDTEPEAVNTPAEGEVTPTDENPENSETETSTVEGEVVSEDEDLSIEDNEDNDNEKVATLEAQIASLTEQIESQKQQLQSTQNQYMRLNADFENFRRRTNREKEELEQQIKKKTITQFLSVVDNFERARSQIKPNTDGEMSIHKSYQGVYKTFVESLKKVGVSAMRAEGEPFDPNYHEAMLREPTSEYPEGTVIEQLVRGYLLNEDVLRHAMVKVATEPEEGSSEEDNSNSENISEEV